MGFADIFKGVAKGVAGGLGGAAQGAAAAYPGIIQNQQATAERADLTNYRNATLAQNQAGMDLDREQFAETQTQNRWERAFTRREQMIARQRADAERTRADADLIRAQQATRTAASAANQEQAEVRLARASKVISQATPQMGPDELDHIARLSGFTSYGQALAVMGAASGEQYGPMMGGYNHRPTTPMPPSGPGPTAGGGFGMDEDSALLMRALGGQP